MLSKTNERAKKEEETNLRCSFERNDDTLDWNIFGIFLSKSFEEK